MIFHIPPVVAFYVVASTPVALILLIVVLWIGDTIGDRRHRG